MRSDQKKIRIAETQDFNEATVSFLNEFASVEVKSCTQSDLKRIFEEVDVFWFRLGFVIDKTTISKKSRVKIIVTPVTGIDHIDENICRENNIQIVCLRGEYDFLKEIRATAEHTIGLTLSLLRNVVIASNSVREGNWERDLFRGYELYNKTVGILGYGRLGKIVATYFLAFGCKVLVYDIECSITSEENNVTFVDNLDSLFLQSDIISVHVNYFKENHHLIDKNLLAKMPSNSVIVNTSRGGLIDENALLNALVTKKIRGAAIDVIQNESNFNPDSPLIKYARENSNLLITPHIGGNTYESFEKTEMFLAQKVREIIKKTK